MPEPMVTQPESHRLPLDSNLSNCFLGILTTMKTELPLLSAKHPTFPTQAHTQFEAIIAISLSSANCLSLIVSSFLPQPSPAYWLWYVFHRISFSSLSLESTCQHTDYSCCDKHSISSAVSSGLILLRKQLSPPPSFFIMLHARSPPSLSIPAQAHPGHFFKSVLKWHRFLNLDSPVSCCLHVSGQPRGQQDKSFGPCKLSPSLILALHKLQ